MLSHRRPPHTNATKRLAVLRDASAVRLSRGLGLAVADGLAADGVHAVVATNPISQALYSEMYLNPDRPVNIARFVVLDSRATRFFGNWERAARESVGALRIQAGRDPYDRQLSNLIGELSTRSDFFRTWWAKHDVYVHGYGVKCFRHPVIGQLELAFDVLELPGDTGMAMVAYSAEPGSAAEDGLKLLANWAATAQAESARSTDGG